MSHLDEGRLTLLLDGELTPTERGEAERHLAACADCRRLLAEVRELAGEADRLVATVEPAPHAAPTLPVRRARRWERWRPVAWAATVVLAAGLGWFSSGLRLRSEADSAVTGMNRMALDSQDRGQLASETTALAVPAPAAPTPAAPRGAVADQRRERAALSAATGAAAAAELPTEAQPMAKANLADEAEQPAPAAPTNQVRSGRPPAPEPTAQLAPAEGARRQPSVPRTEAAEVLPDFRTIPLEGAVQVLGGTVRLLDGFTPAEVRVGPGRLVPGADPLHSVVRVIYLDPPGRELWLDQQRISVPEAGLAARQAGLDLLAGDTLVGPAMEGLTRVRWLDQDGFHLALTGRLSGDSLRILARRVR